MTTIQKNSIKNNLTAFITISNFVLLLSFVWYQAQWQERVDAHIEKKEIHHTFQNNAKYFVPRTEVQLQLNNIENILKEIKVQQDKLRDQ